MGCTGQREGDVTQALPHLTTETAVRRLPQRSERWQRRFIGIVALLDTLAIIVPVALAIIFFDDGRISNGRVLLVGALPFWLLILASKSSAGSARLD
jgi:hypothetical protein